MGKVLPKDFFDREVLEVAPDLLGKYLVRKDKESLKTELKITEVEAYRGKEDLACHASRGETPRTKVMFGQPGRFYVYLVYGMHYMLNIVTGPGGFPSAVLIRGVEGIEGPGRLTRGLGVDKSFNSLEVSTKSGLWVVDNGIDIGSKMIKKTPRIGVDYAGSVWSQKPYRFVLKS